MKKILMFAAIAALFSFMSCQKEDNPAKEEAKDLVFTATIDGGTKTTVDAANAKVAWVTGDQVAISDNASHTATYQVSAIDTQGKATFTKVSGDVLSSAPFTATYGSAPAASQTYSATAPALPMSATSSTTSLNFNVTCGLLELTLTQAGESIKSIKVSDNATTPNTYTLNCENGGSGVSIASGAKFYIAVPAGTYTAFQFTNGTGVVRGRAGLSIAVAANHIKPVSSNFAPKYSSGTTDLDYGIKVGSTWWAPVNCGYNATNYKYGKMYQWGRAVGGGYNDGSIYTETIYQEATAFAPSGTAQNTNPADNIFYKGTESLYDWYTTEGAQLSAWPMKSGDSGYVAGKIANPCPSGWRVPNATEMNELRSNYSSWTTNDGINGYYFSGNVTYSKTVPSVFLPAAGYRGKGLGLAQNRGAGGYYWVSSVTGIHAERQYFTSEKAFLLGATHRAFGFSVRCVIE